MQFSGQGGDGGAPPPPLGGPASREEDRSLTTKRTGAKALALLACSAMALTACSTSSGGSSSSTSTSRPTTANATFTWAYEQEFSSYNGNTSDGNSSANFVVLNPVLFGFWQFAPDGSVQPQPDFGTYQKTSDSPLTVKYTFNAKAVWSDGKPIDCDDAMMTWMANSGLTGDKGFSYASKTGYQDMNKPDCKAGDKTFTIVYKKTFADWSSMFGPGAILPAHVVEQQAGMTKTFIDYASGTVSPALASDPAIAKAINFYNTGWQLNPGQLKKPEMPAAGPYQFDNWVAGQSMTLTLNPKWWGTPPRLSRIVLRYIGGSAQSQALQNGEVNAMDPQPQVDIVKQLQALGSQVKFSTHDQYTFEHLDFNFKTVFKDKNLREAFAKCVPRQQIIDNLIKPVNPNVQIMQSRYIFPFQPTYSQFATGVGGQAYNTVDIAGAKALVAASGVKQPITVRIGWRKDQQVNKRRADTLTLLQSSCNQAGFKVVDAGTPTFFSKEWPNGQFDVAMFAWAGSPLVTGSDGIYTTGGGNNPDGYSNPQVDSLTTQLDQELDKDKQVQIIKQIDTTLWTDLATIPLYAFPAVLATGANVQGVVYNPTQADLSWNAQDWSLQ